MTKAGALYKFWNSFLTAHEENSVPTDATFPYITYQLVTDSFENNVQMSVSIWDRDKNGYSANNFNNSKTEEISKAIGRGGVFLNCDGGKIWLKRGTPFAQNMGNADDNLIRRKYLNITAEFLTAD